MLAGEAEMVVRSWGVRQGAEDFPFPQLSKKEKARAGLWSVGPRKGVSFLRATDMGKMPDGRLDTSLQEWSGALASKL